MRLQPWIGLTFRKHDAFSVDMARWHDIQHWIVQRTGKIKRKRCIGFLFGEKMRNRDLQTSRTTLLIDDNKSIWHP
ncbi:hypothetical protein D3C84_176870 [compost metagenome]